MQTFLRPAMYGAYHKIIPLDQNGKKLITLLLVQFVKALMYFQKTLSYLNIKLEII